MCVRYNLCKRTCPTMFEAAHAHTPRRPCIHKCTQAHAHAHTNQQIFTLTNTYFYTNIHPHSHTWMSAKYAYI